jgi:Pyridoxamine 5'-phosphate oxidase
MSTTSTASSTAPLTLDEQTLWRKIESRSFCNLATTCPDGTPHVAGVLYAVADRTLYVSTLRPSRKARNVAAAATASGGRAPVSVCIPVRRLPVGPPSSIQFRGQADLLDVDDPALVPLLETKPFRAITSHGELALPGSCLLRIEPGSRFVIYGLGLPLHRLIRDPLHAGGAVQVGG